MPYHTVPYHIIAAKMCSVIDLVEDCSSSCADNLTVSDTVYRRLLLEVMGMEYHPWILSAIGSVVVGLSGIFPLLVIPIDAGASMKNGGGCHNLTWSKEFVIILVLDDFPLVWTLIKGGSSEVAPNNA